MWVFNNKSTYIYYVLILFSFFLIFNDLDFKKNFLLNFFHICIGIISVKIMAQKSCGMLTQAAGIFFLVFFSIFPIHELSNEIIYWEGDDFTDDIRLLGAVSTFLFVFSFWITLNIKVSSSNKILLFAAHTIPASKTRWFVIISITGIFFLFYLFDFQILSLFVKGGELSADLNVDNKFSFLIVEFFLRPLLFNIGLTYILLGPRGFFIKTFFILVMIFAASPSGVSRFLVAALYMPLLMVASMRQRFKGQIILSQNFYIFPCVLLFGLLFVFPILEVFRDYSFEKLSNFSFLEYQQGGSFDAFQMYLRALDVGAISYGYGFLGAIFFFIPRFIWPSKPVTSGIEISQLSYLRLENVSMPIIGELYLNFWYFGVILGAPLLALLFKKIDSYYLRYKCSNLALGHLIYFQLAGLVIYNMRGGILSSFAYTVGILMTWLIINFIIKNESHYKYF